MKLFNIILSSIILSILLVANVQAVQFNSGTVLNTSKSNSSVTFVGTTAYAALANVSDYSVIFVNLSYKLSTLIVNLTSNANWSTPNKNIDSAGMIYILSSTSSQVRINNNFTQNIEAQISFPYSGCSSLGWLLYTPNGGAQIKVPFTCDSTNIITGVSLVSTVSGGTNKFEFSAGNGVLVNTSLQLLIGFLALIVLIFAIGGCLYFFKEQLDVGITPIAVLIFGVTLLILIVLVGMLINYIYSLL